jgi:hypothetical protein
MKKRTIATVVAIAAAGIAAYLIRKKIASRQRDYSEPASGSGGRHVTDAFTKAKSVATGEPGMP